MYLKQIVRIIKGTKINLKLATWDDGTSEWRISLDEPSEKYNEWKAEFAGDPDDEDHYYGYDEGCAP